MFRIERTSDGKTTMLRLIGRIQPEHLNEIRSQLKGNGPGVNLNLEEVTLVDAEVVRFLGSCEQSGIELLHCPPYVGEWILRERWL
jgi:hypothetical protein